MPLRVLLVESHADSRESLALLLQLSGFQVDAATGRPDALAAARSHPPDVIVMEPGGAPVGLAPELRGLCPRSPLLIALTSHIREEDRGRLAAEGFALRVLKPIDPDWLVPFLRAYEGGRAARGSAG
jgi:CheY-like chemotaxis protein